MFVPIGFDAPRMRRPIATYGLVGICILAWIFAQQPLREIWSVRLVLFSGDLAAFKEKLSLFHYPKALLDSMGHWTDRPWTLVSSAFLHAGFVHLAGNMAFLFIFGRAVEGWLGAAKYVPIYLALAALAALGHIAFHAGGASALVGASGAISGVMGLAAAFFPRQRIKVFYLFFFRPGTFEVRAFWALIAWFAWDLGKALLLGGHGGVAFMAHVMGFVGGLAGGIAMLKTGVVARHDWDLLGWWFEKKRRAERAKMLARASTPGGMASVAAADGSSISRRRRQFRPRRPPPSGPRGVGASDEERRARVVGEAADLLLQSHGDPASSLRALSLYEELVTLYPGERLPAFAEKTAVQICRQHGEPGLEVRAIERFLRDHRHHPDAQKLALRGVKLCREELMDSARARDIKRAFQGSY
jgi:membrane associated rhomboid family serine protease